MRVAQIVAHPPFREGTGTAAYYYAEALRKLGCDVTVYAPDRVASDLRDDLVNYRLMPCWLAVENAFLTPEILRIRDADVLHLHFPFIFGAELLLARIGDRRPLVVTYHNDLLGGGIRRPLFFAYNRLITPLVLRSATKIAVTSLDHAASSLFADTLLRARRSDVVEVGNGVDTASFHPHVDPEPVIRRLHLRDGDLKVLFVGHLDRAHVRKGLGRLLDTMAKLRSRDYVLIVVGDGDMRDAYQHQAKRLGIADRVRFAGNIPHSRLPAYYAAADVVVIPSKPPESFGLALAEAMASGKPVIGCNIPGVRTVVSDGETGFLIEPDDSRGLADRITLLAGDPDLRMTLGERGRRRIVDRYSWDQVGLKLKAVYDELVD